MTIDADLLSRWRTLGARHSEEVLGLAPRVLKSGNLGEQGKLPCPRTVQVPGYNTDSVEWAVREQLAIAALDLGRISTASVCSSYPPSRNPRLIPYVGTAECATTPFPRFTTSRDSQRSSIRSRSGLPWGSESVLQALVNRRDQHRTSIPQPTCSCTSFVAACADNPIVRPSTPDCLVSLDGHCSKYHLPPPIIPRHILRRSIRMVPPCRPLRRPGSLRSSADSVGSCVRIADLG